VTPSCGAGLETLLPPPGSCSRKSWGCDPAPRSPAASGSSKHRSSSPRQEFKAARGSGRWRFLRRGWCHAVLCGAASPRTVPRRGRGAPGRAGGLVPLPGSGWASAWVLPSLYFKSEHAHGNRFLLTLLYRTRSLSPRCRERRMRLDIARPQQSSPTHAREAHAGQSIPPASPHTPALGIPQRAAGSCRGRSPRGAGPAEGPAATSTTSERSGKAPLSFVTWTFCTRPQWRCPCFDRRRRQELLAVADQGPSRGRGWSARGWAEQWVLRGAPAPSHSRG